MIEQVPTVDRGVYRLRKSDRQQIHYLIELVGEHYKARLWTEDGKRDTVAGPIPATPENLVALEDTLTDLATAWLLEPDE
jgi:hypothetical protein